MLPIWLRELKRVGIGIPMNMFEGEPDKNGNFSDEAEKNAEDKWNKILDDIIEGFQLWVEEDGEWNFNLSKNPEESRKKFKVIYKESALSEKEKRARLFEVFDILFSEKDLLNKNYKNK
jgi:glutathionylspermidine synthase